MLKEVKLFYDPTTNILHAMDTEDHTVHEVVLKENSPRTEGRFPEEIIRMEPKIKVDVLPRY